MSTRMGIEGRRPYFVKQSDFRRWLPASAISRVIYLNGKPVASALAKWESSGRPLKYKLISWVNAGASGKTTKGYRILDIVARARAECIEITESENKTKDVKMHDASKRVVRLLEQACQLRKECKELNAQREQMALAAGFDELLTAIDSRSMLTEAQVVSGRISFEKLSGVYFLIKNEKVVYVGQSVNVAARIHSHIGAKDFDSYAWVKVPSHNLNVVESLYIHHFRPHLNGNAPISFEGLISHASRSFSQTKSQEQASYEEKMANLRRISGLA